MIRNQVDLHYFYKPKIDVYISFKLLDIGVIAILATHSLYRVVQNQRISHTRVVCANGAGIHQPALFDILSGILIYFPWVINGIIEV